MDQLPNGLISFGPDANCTLELCPIEYTVYGYRPSLAANIAFPAIFALIGVVHAYLGWRWRSWGFMTGMILGCVSEIIGYVGRVLLHNSPFSFVAFMIQIVCITIAPVFFTASIYVTLSKTIMHFGPELSRFRPQLFYWIFIPFDIVCLILQAAGGAMTTEATDPTGTGVNISMAGLALQVIVLTAFMVTFVDYMIRLVRHSDAVIFTTRVKTFLGGLTAASLLILARCAYRVAELKDGYSGSLVKEEGPFIGLEGVIIVLAAISLCFGHPGLVLKQNSRRVCQQKDVADSGESTIGIHEK